MSCNSYWYWVLSYPFPADAHSWLQGLLKRLLKFSHLAFIAKSCSIIAYLLISSAALNRNIVRCTLSPSSLLSALLTKRKKGLFAEPRCSEWNYQSHMVPNVQRTLIEGNRKSQLACRAVQSHMQTVVFAGSPKDRCHLDVFKWVVIHWRGQSCLIFGE